MLFSIKDFFRRHWRFTGQQGKGGDHFSIPLYYFHSLRNIQTSIFNLYMRWLSSIFNHNACIYQTPTQSDLPPYWVTIWLIDWLMMQRLFVLGPYIRYTGEQAPRVFVGVMKYFSEFLMGHKKFSYVLSFFFSNFF